MMTSYRKGFTMIELVFVIVVIGILSAIAIPKLAATRDDAIISKARTTVASLRSAVSTERQKHILRGDFSDINGSTAEGLLEYGLGSGWTRSGDDFTFAGPNGNAVFNLRSNKLDCNTSASATNACNDFNN